MPELSKIVIATHDGQFHADEVLSVAILSTMFKNHEILRTRDLELLETADFVVDVGGIYDHQRRRYDHHMPNPPTDNYGRLLSSAGLIWGHYGKSYLRTIGIPKEYDHDGTIIPMIDAVASIIDRRWILPIDRVDNGMATMPTPISEIVSTMTPVSFERDSLRYDIQFTETVKLVSRLFERACFHAIDKVIAPVAFRNSDKEYLLDNRVLVVDTEVKGFGHFIPTDIHFVVYPIESITDGNTYYIIRPIHGVGGGEYKTPIPDALLGITEKDAEDHGLSGIQFVHHTGFMVRAYDKDSAIEFCRLLLDGYPKTK